MQHCSSPASRTDDWLRGWPGCHHEDAGNKLSILKLGTAGKGVGLLLGNHRPSSGVLGPHLHPRQQSPEGAQLALQLGAVMCLQLGLLPAPLLMCSKDEMQEVVQLCPAVLHGAHRLSFSLSEGGCQIHSHSPPIPSPLFSVRADTQPSPSTPNHSLKDKCKCYCCDTEI